MTHLRHKLDQNPAAQQASAAWTCAILSVRSTGGHRAVKRREFIAGLGGAAVRPLAVHAQQSERVRRIGLLMNFLETDNEGKARLAAFLQRMRELGWLEGRNLKLDSRWSGADVDRMRSFAAEIVVGRPDLVVAVGTPATSAVMRETRTIPIVFTQVSDPVGGGLVTSLARPGGNVTGFTLFEFSIGSKWLQTIKEIAPNVTRVAVLFNSTTAPYAPLYLRSVEDAASSFALGFSKLALNDTMTLERAIKAFAATPNSSLIVLTDTFTTVNRNQIIALAAEFHLPAMYPYGFFAHSGGLISYGVDTLEQYPRAAAYADRILKGEKPGDLPIQQPNKYELVINLKTATALGLTVPPSLLARADEVIE
jgi:putative tryptophan/tyrosine transport system substrate-binding protein